VTLAELEAAEALCASLKCSTCSGTGMVYPACPYCHDSTYDHHCPGREVCDRCTGAGHSTRPEHAALAAALAEIRRLRGLVEPVATSSPWGDYRECRWCGGHIWNRDKTDEAVGHCDECQWVAARLHFGLEFPWTDKNGTTHRMERDLNDGCP
jgi:hypothetical protein